jgi:hypothetical protein
LPNFVIKRAQEVSYVFLTRKYDHFYVFSWLFLDAESSWQCW